MTHHSRQHERGPRDQDRAGSGRSASHPDSPHGEWHNDEGRRQYGYGRGEQDGRRDVTQDGWPDVGGDYGEGGCGGGGDASFGEYGMRRSRGYEDSAPDDWSGGRSRDERPRGFGGRSGPSGYRQGGYGGRGSYDDGQGGQGGYGGYGGGPGGYEAGQGGQGGYGGHGPAGGDERGAPYGERGRTAAAGGGFRGKGPKDYTRSDQRIQEDLCERLSDDDAIDASEISVKVENGVVTLTGSVDARWIKHRAEDLAEDCSGVRDINNQLRVGARRDRSSDTGTPTPSSPA